MPRSELERAAAAAAAELGALPDPGVRVLQALERLERCGELIARDEWWPGELDRIALPGGNGAALSTPVCLGYTRALAELRRACEHQHVARTHALLGELLAAFGRRYEALKRSVSGLDFEDLELITRDLLAEHDELRERYAARFERIMVDELQDTNGVQLALIASIARGQAGDGRTGNLFTVGDAQQSIYAFRHADVELFEQLSERLAARGRRATLQTNFRSRSEIIDVLNASFANELGEQFMPLVAARTDPPAGQPLVELLIADKAADWEVEGLAAPWRRAEARALAERIRELIDGGAAPREIVVLTRATTDLRAYERALEDCGIPTYLIGGRGYWSHPQIVDMVAYLRALANPRDEEALYTLLASPLVGLSLGGLVLLAAGARAASRDPWWVVREPTDQLDELDRADRERLDRFAEWFESERAARARISIDQLIERALVLTGYDLRILALQRGPAAARKRAQTDAAGTGVRGRSRRRPVRVPGTCEGSCRRLGGRPARERSARRGRGARRGAADDDPPGEGARVRDRVRGRSGTRPVAARGADADRARRPLRSAAQRTGHGEGHPGARLPGARR